MISSFTPKEISKFPTKSSGRYFFTSLINLAQICSGNSDPVNPFDVSNGGKLLSNPTHTTTTTRGVNPTNHKSASPVPVLPASARVASKPVHLRADFAVPYWPSGPSPTT